ncbi:MAG: DUF4926 domain-containing protein [Chloroflexi bacterium]|nr:DUF4926 domain-containing protein [Chloroflexota bacterium]
MGTRLVALAQGVPSHGLIAGDVGTVVLVHGRDAAFEVEFVNADGRGRQRESRSPVGAAVAASVPSALPDATVEIAPRLSTTSSVSISGYTSALSTINSRAARSADCLS